MGFSVFPLNIIYQILCLFVVFNSKRRVCVGREFCPFPQTTVMFFGVDREIRGEFVCSCGAGQPPKMAPGFLLSGRYCLHNPETEDVMEFTYVIGSVTWYTCLCEKAIA